MAIKEKQRLRFQRQQKKSNPLKYSTIHVLIFTEQPYVPDTGNTDKDQMQNLTNEAVKYVIVIKHSAIIGKAFGAMGTCSRSAFPSQGVKESLLEEVTFNLNQKDGQKQADEGWLRVFQAEETTWGHIYQRRER